MPLSRGLAGAVEGQAANFFPPNKQAGMRFDLPRASFLRHIGGEMCPAARRRRCRLRPGRRPPLSVAPLVTAVEACISDEQGERLRHSLGGGAMLR